MLSKIEELKHYAVRHPLMAGLGGVVVILVLWYAIAQLTGPGKNKRAPRGVPVEVEEVRTGSLTRRINAVGTLVANQTVDIRAEVSGLVREINVKGGTEIQAGDVIITLDDRTYQAELRELQARYAFLKADFDRAEALNARNFGSTKNKQKAMAELQSVEANIEATRIKIENTQIKAPFEGVVSINNISIGTAVSPNAELFTIVDMDPILLDFRIPSQYLHSVSVGQTIDVQVDGFGEEAFEATVQAIDAKVDPTAHSITIRASINNENRILKPGLFARVNLVVGSKDNAVMVPTSAIESTSEEEFVYRVIDGVAFKVPVSTGLAEGDNTEITRGLNAGDIVVTVGQQKIRDGVPVTYTLDGVKGGYGITPPQEAKDAPQESVLRVKKKAQDNEPAQGDEKKSAEEPAAEAQPGAASDEKSSSSEKDAKDSKAVAPSAESKSSAAEESKPQAVKTTAASHADAKKK
ncbi:MAG: efflux RND transporter periplasmic adaptor subunit [Holosporales bacterium]